MLGHKPTGNEITAAELLPRTRRRCIPGRTGWLFALVFLFGAGLWFSHALQRAREAANRTVREGCLNQIQMALFNYHDSYGRLPPLR